MASGYSDGGAVSVTLEVPPSSPSSPAAPATPATPGSPGAPGTPESPVTPGHTGPLPFTGFEIEWLIVAAIALIIAGLLLLTILRTRLESSHA